MAVAKAKGRLKGKRPKLSNTRRKHLLTLHAADEHPDCVIAYVPDKVVETPGWAWKP